MWTTYAQQTDQFELMTMHDHMVHTWMDTWMSTAHEMRMREVATNRARYPYRLILILILESVCDLKVWKY